MCVVSAQLTTTTFRFTEQETEAWTWDLHPVPRNLKPELFLLQSLDFLGSKMAFWLPYGIKKREERCCCTDWTVQREPHAYLSGPKEAGMSGT